MRLHSSVIVFALALALTLSVTERAAAQKGLFEPFAGVLIVDDGELTGTTIDPGFLVGAVLGWSVAPGWEVAGAYGFSPITAKNDDGTSTDAKIHVYFGAVDYILPYGTTTKLFLTGGVGGIAIDPNLDNAKASNDLLVNFGGGLRWMSSGRWALQGEVRDHVQFCKMEAEGSTTISICPGGDKALHHVEVSGGVVFLF